MRRRVLGLILAATLLAVTLLGAGTYIYVRKLMIERTEERMEDIARLLLSGARKRNRQSAGWRRSTHSMTSIA